MRYALFLDRDGTIIVDRGYPDDPAGVAYLSGAREALLSLMSIDTALVVVSNQSGVARGLISPAAAASVHDAMIRMLRNDGIEIAGSYYCFHGPEDGCRCRKPGPGLLEQAFEALRLSRVGAVMIGDKVSDVGAGRAVGAHTILLGAEKTEGCAANFVATDWPAVVKHLKSRTTEEQAT
jgi:D-glycero-D-manno-heptose 1,7-bisphosphate phosphatase